MAVVTKLPTARALWKLGFSSDDIRAALIRSCEDDHGVKVNDAIKIVDAALDDEDALGLGWDDAPLDRISAQMIDLAIRRA